MLFIYFYGSVGAGVAQYSGCAAGWTIWGSDPGKRKVGFSSPKRLNRPWGPHRLVFSGYGIYFPGCNVTQHLIFRLGRVELYLDSTNTPLPLRLCLMMLPIAGPSGRAVCGRSPAEIVGSNPTGGIDVCRVFCAGRGLSVGLINRPEESCRLWCVVI